MADSKPICRCTSQCYSTNPDHLNTYCHPHLDILLPIYLKDPQHFTIPYWLITDDCDFNEIDEVKQQLSILQTFQNNEVSKDTGFSQHFHQTSGNIVGEKEPAKTCKSVIPVKPDSDSKPECPYTTRCHRTNPDHFSRFSHPHLDILLPIYSKDPQHFTIPDCLISDDCDFTEIDEVKQQLGILQIFQNNKVGQAGNSISATMSSGYTGQVSPATTIFTQHFLQRSGNIDTEKPAMTCKPVIPVKSESNSKPVCPYKTQCYRTNPDHFSKYCHPHLDVLLPAADTRSVTSTPKTVEKIVKYSFSESELNVECHIRQALSLCSVLAETSSPCSTNSLQKKESLSGKKKFVVKLKNVLRTNKSKPLTDEENVTTAPSKTYVWTKAIIIAENDLTMTCKPVIADKSCRNVLVSSSDYSLYLLPLSEGDEIEFLVGDNDDIESNVFNIVRIVGFSARSSKTLLCYFSQTNGLLSKDFNHEKMFRDILPCRPLWLFLSTLYFEDPKVHLSYLFHFMHVLNEMMELGSKTQSQQFAYMLEIVWTSEEFDEESRLFEFLETFDFSQSPDVIIVDDEHCNLRNILLNFIENSLRALPKLKGRIQPFVYLIGSVASPSVHRWIFFTLSIATENDEHSSVNQVNLQSGPLVPDCQEPNGIRCGLLSHNIRRCLKMVDFKFPDCGHQGSKICFENIEDCRCMTDVDVKLKRCGHVVSKKCHLDEAQLKCSHNCNKKMSCNLHPCHSKCSPEHEHQYCRKTVHFDFPGCKHPSSKMCCEEIDDRTCETLVDYTFPTCGHTRSIKCYLVGKTKCLQIVKFNYVRCGHNGQRTCWKSEDQIPCMSRCSSLMDCNRHLCIKKCSIVHSHTGCDAMIDFKFIACGHSSPRQKVCSEVITWECEHEVLEKGKCGHPIKRKCCKEGKCEMPCTKLRKCKHLCVNKCSDDCEIDSCSECDALYKQSRKLAHEEYKRLQEAVKKNGGMKPEIFNLLKSGESAAEYQRVEDQVLKFIKQEHNWYPLITNIEKVINLKLQCDYQKYKTTAFGDYEDFKFHGTGEAGVIGITQNGFKVGSGGMYGAGIYFATDSSKSSQGKYTKGSNKLLLCRVFLGKSKTCKKACREMTHEQLRKEGFDSVYAPRDTHNSGGVLFDEFVVFDSKQAYPEYIISYEDH